MTEDKKSEWKKKIGVGERQVYYGKYAGTNKKTPVINDNNGRVGGFQTEHWSGRVDATVTPPRTRIVTRTMED